MLQCSFSKMYCVNPRSASPHPVLRSALVCPARRYRRGARCGWRFPAPTRRCCVVQEYLAGDQGRIVAVPGPQSEQMVYSPLWRFESKSEFLRTICKRSGQVPAVLLNGCRRQIQHHFQCRHQHGNEHKVAALTHVESDGARMISIPISNDIAEFFASFPAYPVFLKGSPVVPALGIVGKAERVRTEQPFVSGTDHRVGAYALDIEGKGAHRLRSVYDQCCSYLAGPAGNDLKIKERAVDPVYVGYGYDRCPCLDRLQDTLIPSGRSLPSAFTGADGFQRGACVCAIRRQAYTLLGNCSARTTIRSPCSTGRLRRWQPVHTRQRERWLRNRPGHGSIVRTMPGVGYFPRKIRMLHTGRIAALPDPGYAGFFHLPGRGGHEGAIQIMEWFGSEKRCF